MCSANDFIVLNLNKSCVFNIKLYLTNFVWIWIKSKESNPRVKNGVFISTSFKFKVSQIILLIFCSVSVENVSLIVSFNYIFGSFFLSNFPFGVKGKVSSLWKYDGII